MIGDDYMLYLMFCFISGIIGGYIFLRIFSS